MKFRRRIGHRLLRDLGADLEEHIEREARENMERGMPEAAARRAARIKLGNPARIIEDTREVWVRRWLETLLQDFTFALRMLRRTPGLTVVAILTMALSIGAATGIFSLVDATLLHPLPYAHPEQLVRLEDDLPGAGARDVGLSLPEWEDFQHSGLFQFVSPTQYDDNNLTGGRAPQQVRLLMAAPNYFALLQATPELGRTFDPNFRGPGFLTEVVISDGLWRGTFGGDPNILGRSLHMDTDLYRVIGVMPPEYHDPGRDPRERNVEVWAADSYYGPPNFVPWPRTVRGMPTAIARLRPGLTLEEAQQRMDALTAALRQKYPGDYPAAAGWRVRLVPLQASVTGEVRPTLLVLLTGVGIILLIGCVNIANLLLARTGARRQEMAIRRALGGGRLRLIRQMLTESLLLASLGAGAGLALLYGARNPLLQLLPPSLPRLNAIGAQGPVLWFTLGVTAAAGVLFGLAPALQASRAPAAAGLRDAGRGSTGARKRMQRTLVVMEFALALVLVIAGGLLLRSFSKLTTVGLGFRPESVMAVMTRMPYPNDPMTDRYRTAAQQRPFFQKLAAGLRTLPGVKEVAFADNAAFPLAHDRDNQTPPLPLRVEGWRGGDDQRPLVDQAIVAPEYFHLMGMTLLRGRELSDLDAAAAAPVAVVNQAMARRFFPDGNAIGRRFQLGRGAWTTVVGVVADARAEKIEDSDVPEIYTALYQRGAHHLVIFFRGTMNAGQIEAQVRAQVQAVDPTLPVFGTQQLPAAVAASLAQRRFAMDLVGCFAAASLLLAGLGIFGVMAYTVGERRREIGIRRAMGARGRDVVRLVLREGMTLAIVGAMLGLGGGVAAARALAGLLFGVSWSDPATFGLSAAALIAVALLGCYLPARRALRVDPMASLREQ